MNRRKSRRGKARLVGFGIDENGAEIRVTRGPGFELFDGDEDTHKRMQDKAMEFVRKVTEKGLSLDNISRGECREILAEMDLNSGNMGAA